MTLDTDQKQKDLEEYMQRCHALLEGAREEQKKLVSSMLMNLVRFDLKTAESMGFLQIRHCMMKVNR